MLSSFLSSTLAKSKVYVPSFDEGLCEVYVTTTRPVYKLPQPRFNHVKPIIVFKPTFPTLPPISPVLPPIPITLPPISILQSFVQLIEPKKNQPKKKYITKKNEAVPMERTENAVAESVADLNSVCTPSGSTRALFVAQNSSVNIKKTRRCVQHAIHIKNASTENGQYAYAGNAISVEYIASTTNGKATALNARPNASVNMESEDRHANNATQSFSAAMRFLNTLVNYAVWARHFANTSN